MNFREAERYLLSLGNEVETMKLGLDNIRKLLTALGDPQNNYLKVQVAGTNGKGSVCAFLRSICLDAGINAGVYTSPHLISITERINIGGVDISEDDFARLATKVRETSEQLAATGEIDGVPTFFEQITAIALLAFGVAKVDVAILETGLGGRLDATTAADAEIAAITRIDYDHQAYLGDTLTEIASEKAAIIRSGATVVIGNQSIDAMAVLLDRSSSVGVVPKTVCEPNVIVTSQGSAVAEFRTNQNQHWALGLAGRHQVENACTTILIAETLRDDFGFPITLEHIWLGLENARHRGRLEYIGDFLLDGAHNVGGAKALAAYIEEFEQRPITLVFGAMNDKNVAEILSILAPLAKGIVLTKPSNSRSVACGELLAQMPSGLPRKNISAADTISDALDIAGKLAPSDGLIIVTGSLYLVGEVRSLLTQQSEI